MSLNPNGLRAALLGRVSTTKKSQFSSHRRQLDELRALAARRGWTVAGVAFDKASGSDFRRPGLLAMVDLVVRGKAEVLVVHDLDRLGRDTREMLATVDTLSLAGGNLFVMDNNIDTTSPGGRLTFTVFAAIAEFNRRDLKRRVIAGLEHARKKGKVLGRPAVLRGELLEQAVALRRDGKTWGQIAEQLPAYERTSIATAVTRRQRRSA